MIYAHPPVKHRAWWDTDFCRGWQLTGIIARLWGRHFAPVSHEEPENDRDHIRW
jgi:hypothetical protein